MNIDRSSNYQVCYATEPNTKSNMKIRKYFTVKVYTASKASSMHAMSHTRVSYFDSLLLIIL